MVGEDDTPEAQVPVPPVTHDDAEEVQDGLNPYRGGHPEGCPHWRRDTYLGSLAFNMAALILPALYGTLSKLWVANIDSSLIVTTDTYTYMSVAAEAINEGLPRAAWVIIGDRASRSLAERLQLTHTLILFQATLGLILSLAFLFAAPNIANAFVPSEVRATSISYVRISAFSVLSSTVEIAVASASRALDQPDVPLVISTIKLAVNILLDLLLISRFHVSFLVPSVNMQAAIQLACNLVAASAGMVYYILSSPRPHPRPRQRQRSHETSRETTQDSLLRLLLRPGLIFFVESAVRNVLYLWLVHTIVKLGSTYATAWSVFVTIRWGLVMVPVVALEATTLQFTGHAWGSFRSIVGVHDCQPQATRQQVLTVTRPALKSLGLVLLVEGFIAVFFSRFGVRPLAEYLSGSKEVSLVTEEMWHSIGWCYVFYAMTTQIAAILQATHPKWYLWQSLASNLLYVLPWAIVCQVFVLDIGNAWIYHRLVFGGSLVFSFFDVLVVVAVWAWKLLHGSLKLESYRA